MRLHRLALAALLAAIPAVAQYSSGPGVCFSFNTGPQSTNYIPLVVGGEVYFGFRATTTASIERIDFNVGLNGGVSVSAQVFQALGTTLGAMLGSAPTNPNTGGLLPVNFTAPVALTGGVDYAIRFYNPTGLVLFMGDTAAPTPIQYLLYCGTLPATMSPACTTFPVSGTHGTTMTFRSSSCGQTPYASVVSRGIGCGPASSSLLASTPPILGAPFFFHLNGFFQTGSCQIFWAIGPATAGTDLGIGTGCLSYLDMASVQSLAAGGFEPLLNIPIMGVFNGTPITLPLNPAYAGLTMTAQAVLFLSTPTGMPTPYGNFTLTNALELTLGY